MARVWNSEKSLLSQFFSSTMDFPAINPGSQAWQQTPLSSESFPWAKWGF